eukprot:gene2078-biopygen7350
MGASGTSPSAPAHCQATCGPPHNVQSDAIGGMTGRAEPEPATRAARGAAAPRQLLCSALGSAQQYEHAAAHPAKAGARLRARHPDCEADGGRPTTRKASYRARARPARPRGEGAWRRSASGSRGPSRSRPCAASWLVAASRELPP